MDYKLEYNKLEKKVTQLNIETSNFNFKQKRLDLITTFNSNLYSFLNPFFSSKLPPNIKTHFSELCFHITYEDQPFIKLNFSFDPTLKLKSKKPIKSNQIDIEYKLPYTSKTSSDFKKLILLGNISRIVLNNKTKFLKFFNSEFALINKTITTQYLPILDNFQKEYQKINKSQLDLLYLKIYDILTNDKILYIKNFNYMFNRNNYHYPTPIKYIKILDSKNNVYNIEIESIYDDEPIKYYMSTKNLENFIKDHIIHDDFYPLDFVFKD